MNAKEDFSTAHGASIPLTLPSRAASFALRQKARSRTLRACLNTRMRAALRSNKRFSASPIYDDFELLKLTDSLAFMRDELGASNPTMQKF
jgi:hypothetical protein